MNGYLQEIRIGQVQITCPLALGPMAGVTDMPFRLLCLEQGAGLLYTEMISAKAVLYHNRNTEALMQIHPSEHPVALQLFGNDPDVMAEAAAMIEERPFDLLDINMGCPVPKVVNNQEGSALMRDPRRAAAIVKAVAERIRKPVTVKIRKGFSEEEANAPYLAALLEDAGASMIAVHGRTRDQYYAGKADWDSIRRVKEAVSIPVIANGDADSPEHVKGILDATGADGVMIARAARGNPWIFAETRAYLSGKGIPARPSAQEICGTIRRHMDMLESCKGEMTAVNEMRKHIAWYTSGMPHSAALRRKVNEAAGREEVMAILQEMLIYAGQNEKSD